MRDIEIEQEVQLPALLQVVVYAADRVAAACHNQFMHAAGADEINQRFSEAADVGADHGFGNAEAVRHVIGIDAFGAHCGEKFERCVFADVMNSMCHKISFRSSIRIEPGSQGMRRSGRNGFSRDRRPRQTRFARGTPATSDQICKGRSGRVRPDFQGTRRSASASGLRRRARGRTRRRLKGASEVLRLQSRPLRAVPCRACACIPSG